MIKYNEAMERLRVSPELTDRILKKAEPAAKAGRRLKIQKLAACAAAMVVVCFAALAAIAIRPAGSAGPPSFVSPYESFDSLQELEAQAGFGISLPEQLTGGLTYSLVFGATAEITGSLGGREVTLSKSRAGTAPDYGEGDRAKTDSGIDVVLTPNGESGDYYLAVWGDGDYVFALAVEGGASDSELMAIVDMVGEL